MKDRRLIVGIDVGHSTARPGALSARGEPEHTFNYAMARTLVDLSRRHNSMHLELLEERHEDLDFRSRAERAAVMTCQLVISIHHNSVPEEYLEEWTWKGRRLHRSRVASGFSLFVSKANRYYEQSALLARTICSELISGGFQADTGRPQQVVTESRRAIDSGIALYEYNTLTILRMVRCAALLIECGVIVNDLDEPVLASSGFRKSFASCVLKGVHSHFDRLIENK